MMQCDLDVWTTNHATLKDKSTEFFVSRKSCPKKMKLDSSGRFRMENDAFYKIALLIAKDKKPHTIEANDLPWERVIGIYTDGAQMMTGCRSGCIELAKKKNPIIIGTHCIIHRQALAGQSLPESLNTALNLTVKVANHVKSNSLNTKFFRVLCQELNSNQETLLFHTEVRRLSKGDMLARLFNLKSEVEIFLMSTSEELYKKFTDDKFIFYLVRKVFCLHNSEPNFSSFPKLNNLPDDTQTLPDDLVNEMKDLMLSLKNKIGAYFPDISSENWGI
ncbi:hypothetical protein QE152_g8127 [Popillia japonica]|uniref:Transposase n=1 Tax=Popillia japonica TaxID=7064 RepID=A0AAW1MD23_POPJA